MQLAPVTITPDVYGQYASSYAPTSVASDLTSVSVTPDVHGQYASTYPKPGEFSIMSLAMVGLAMFVAGTFLARK